MADEMINEKLSVLELERYHRHLYLPHVGERGQVQLKQASALVVGVGGLGTINSLYLTLAGIGTLGLIEDDCVSLDNLHRQILYKTEDIGTSKLTIAAQRLKEHNPEVDLQVFAQRLTQDNAHVIISNFDMVVDGTDNLQTRQVINQTCVAQDKPYVYGAVNLFDGQVSVFHASQGPCLACLFPQVPQEEQEKQPEQLAVLNTLPAVVGSLQTTEVFKLIVGLGKPLIGKLLIYNALNVTFERVNVEKNPNCAVCGK